MDIIKYGITEVNYEKFIDNCFNKKIPLGSFYLTGMDYKYNRTNTYTNSDNSVTIYYKIFDPTKHDVTDKVIILAIGENERLELSEVCRIIQGYEYRELHYYLKRHHKNSKINCINEIFEVEYL